ncbi:DUF4386 domain-containing protein [Alisedimentitalea sp. MJ-SS2]|uniref:DUF4386 domain-containing protein n=1 Tax=Aliisedimentitalea sp. MJ-SS2 TaxID=3049795 RepID=UPI002908DA99|nr:DUF4386 domain-containing protein [Alisedimentitalea sp. MJ-SS2]MDU8926027.1 DUF4386 domain-containing protein [Alisedimentitalea sp. MJ-SS2]
MHPSINDAPQGQLLAAGLLYLGIIGLGISSEVLLRGPLIDWTDSTATTWAIATGESRFRLSLGFDLVMAGFDVTLAVMLFHLLRGVDEMWALMAMAFRLMQAAVIAANLLFLVAAQDAIKIGADPLPCLRMHAAGYDLGLAFFGVNALLMAGLLCNWGAPRLFAWGIAAAGLVYLAGSLTRFLAPEWNAAMQPAYLVPVLAETALMAWLLWRGLRPA